MVSPSKFYQTVTAASKIKKMTIKYHPSEIDEIVFKTFEKLQNKQPYRVIWLCPNRRLTRVREAQFAAYMSDAGIRASYLPVFSTPADYAARSLPGRKILSDRERRLTIRSAAAEDGHPVLLKEAEVFIRECKSNLLDPDEAERRLNESLSRAESEYLPPIDTGMWERVRSRVEKLLAIFRKYEEEKEAFDVDDVFEAAAQALEKNNQTIELLVIDSFLDFEPHEQKFVDSLASRAAEVIRLEPDVPLDYEAFPVRESPLPVSIESFQTLLEEIRETANRIAFLIKKGVEPADILVVVPELSEYAGVIEKEFADRHIRVNISTGRKLSKTPAAALLEDLIEFITHRELVSALRVVFNPLLTDAEYADMTKSVAKFSKNNKLYLPDNDEHVQSLISSFDGKPAELLQKANSLHGSDYESVKEFLIEVLDGIELDNEVKASLYEAISALNGKDLKTLKRDFHAALGDDVAPSRGDVADGVQITGVLESRGQSAGFIFLLGFSDEAFPGMPFKSVFLPERIKQELGFPLANEYFIKQKRDFIRLILSARHGLSISYHGISGKDEFLMSRFVREFEYYLNSGKLDKSFTRFTWQKKEIPSTSMKIGIVGQTDEDYEREWEKEKQSVSSEKDHFSVSEILNYMDCPYKFFIENVLGIKEVRLPSSYFAANDLGSFIHKAIENLVQEKLSTQEKVKDLADSIGTNENFLYETLLEKLTEVVRENGLSDEIIIEHRFDKFLSVAAQWLSEKVKEAASKGHYFSPEREVEGELFDTKVKGIIDLIELDASGKPVAIYDFKTGYKSNGDRYKKQLDIYAMLLSGSDALDKLIKRSIIWISEINHATEVINRTHKKLKEIRQEVEKDLQEMKAIVRGEAFPDLGSKSPNCYGCYSDFACKVRLKR